MKNYKVSIITYAEAVYEENVQYWLDNFVVPDLKEKWSNGDMFIITKIEEV